MKASSTMIFKKYPGRHALRHTFGACLLTLLLAACGQSEPETQKDSGAPADNGGSPASPTFSADVRSRPIEDDVIYFMLPDRFNNGDPANDKGGLEGDRLDHGYDPTDKAFYHGGDIKGVTQKLDYLQDLGITAIWMAPIFKNKPVQLGGYGASAGYHGYWITDFTQIDPHFGTNDDLKALVNAAHDRGIKVIFDIITNHTADVIQYRECENTPTAVAENGWRGCPYRPLGDYPYTTIGNPEGAEINAGFRGDAASQQTPENFDHLTDTRWAYTPFVPKAEQDVKVPAWLNDPIYYHNRGETTFEGENSLYGDFASLDDLFTEHPRVLDGMIDIYKFWISEFGIDGFRIDTVKHVNMSFWSKFVPKIKAHAASEGIENFYIFGEVYDPNPENLSRFAHEGRFPALLDFGLQSVMHKTVVEKGPTQTLADFFAKDSLYETDWSHAGQLPIFLGNHDMGRIGHFLTKHYGQNADEGMLLKHARLAHALMFFARGVPVIYYGDEQGFTGDGHDQDAREDMFASRVASYNDNRLIGAAQTSTAEDNFDKSHPLYKTIADLSRIKRAHPALRRGTMQTQLAEDSAGLFAFTRSIDGAKTRYLVLVNTADERRTATLTADSQSDDWTLILAGNAKRDDFSLVREDALIKIQAPALGYAVWKMGR